MQGIAFKILLIFQLFPMLLALITMEKSVCSAIDPDFLPIEVCEVRRTNRNIPAFYLHLHLLQGPLTNVHFNVQLYYMRNRNPQILFNSSWDLCKVMKNSQKYPSFKITYDLFTQYSNINHTCPFGHDIIINNFVVAKFAMSVLKGAYLIKTNYQNDGQKRLSVDLYMKSD